MQAQKKGMKNRITKQISAQIIHNPLGMKNREERSKHFFDSGPLMEEDEDMALYERVRNEWM